MTSKKPKLELVDRMIFEVIWMSTNVSWASQTQAFKKFDKL